MSSYQDQPAWDSQPPPPPPPMPQTGELAGFWRRFGGALIDGILIGIVATLIGSLLGLNSGTATTGGGSVSLALAPSRWLQTLLSLAYFTYLHAQPAGQSLGNRALGIRVVDEATGQSLDYTRAFIRTIGSYLSGFVLLLGFLWMLWDPRKQTWHDKFARSLVVRAS